MLSATISVLAVALVLGSLYQPLDLNPLFITQKNATVSPAIISQKLLLVTAHPDDEAMFFAPTILSLNSKPTELFHICLSHGNAEGLGAHRKTELTRSLDILGIDPGKRWIVDHPDLQDNFTFTWGADVVATVLKPYVLKNNIDTILTFDDDGVSGHPNHRAIPVGTRKLIQTLPNPPRLFTLQTVSLFTKYLSILGTFTAKIDIFWHKGIQYLEVIATDTFGNFYPQLLVLKYRRHPDTNLVPVFTSGHQGYAKALEAMKAHESQLVWFRWLYVGFSQYMWVNAWMHDAV